MNIRETLKTLNEDDLDAVRTEHAKKQYVVIHNQTGKTLTKPMGFHSAKRSADKRDLQYGAINHHVKKVAIS